MKVKFHGPHPGLMGCRTRLPEPVRIFAESLNGSEENISTVISKLSEIDPAGTFVNVLNPKEDREEFDGFIMYTLEYPSGRIDGWRVICYDLKSSGLP